MRLKPVILWTADLLILAVALFWPMGPFDVYYHDRYFVIALPHVLLALWLLFTVPLLLWTLRRVRRA